MPVVDVVHRDLRHGLRVADVADDVGGGTVGVVGAVRYVDVCVGADCQPHAPEAVVVVAAEEPRVVLFPKVPCVGRFRDMFSQYGYDVVGNVDAFLAGGARFGVARGVAQSSTTWRRSRCGKEHGGRVVAWSPAEFGRDHVASREVITVAP